MEGDQLYGLPLERFVPERDALVKTLRGEGRREEAAEVAKLRKPSVAAWAVNQLVRTQAKAWQDLLAAGDGLAESHAAVVSGTGDGASLRAAVERERAAVDDLMAAARGLLSGEGHDLSPTTIDRVADTLHAAALEPDARAQVADGRLERELRHVGLGSFALGGIAPPPPKKSKPAKKAPKRSKQDRAGAGEAQRTSARAAEAERKAVRAAEADARKRLERAERGLKAATEDRDRAARELAEAEHALADARAEAEQAAEAHRTAAERLDHVM